MGRFPIGNSRWFSSFSDCGFSVLWRLFLGSCFQRFDLFNQKYNPFGQARLRDVFLKTDNHIKGNSYFIFLGTFVLVLLALLYFCAAGGKRLLYVCWVSFRPLSRRVDARGHCRFGR